MTYHIGYPMATISYTGTVQWQPEPFGDVISEQSVGPGHDPLIRYPGQWRVEPVLATSEPAFTTLYYNTHRWYNPSWGRYTHGDPLGLKGGLSLFLYADANPLKLIDPSGLTSTPTPVPRPFCDGEWKSVRWERKWDLRNLFGPRCYCWWLCRPCDGSFMWSGDFAQLPRQNVTESRITHTGRDIESGDVCDCPKPGGEEGCECKTNGMPTPTPGSTFTP